MEVTAPCFTLLMVQFILLGTQVQSNYTQKVSGAVCLRITPNRLQHFEYESVSFHCESTDGSAKLKGIKNAKEYFPACNFKGTSTGSFCTFDKAYTEDSGEYWCETKEGERSNIVNITVTGGPVILESPALVLESEAVTLHCSRNTTSTSLAVFYKDDVPLQSSPAEEMRINNVSKSDEGVYRCSISDVGTSSGSWLVVRAHEVLLCHPSEPANFLVLLWIAVTILMLVLLVVGFLHIRKHRGSADTGNKLGLCLKTNQSRRPQRDKDEDESSHQLVYATVTIMSKAATGLSSSTTTLDPKSTKCSGLPHEEIHYSTLRYDTKSRDT